MRSVDRLLFAVLFSFVIPLPVCGAEPSTSSEQPNIVLIMSDDK